MSCPGCDPGPCFCMHVDREPKRETFQPTRGGSAPYDFTGAGETLALIAEHRLFVMPTVDDEWRAAPRRTAGFDSYPDPGAFGKGATIGDAVRACVARIKEANRG